MCQVFWRSNEKVRQTDFGNENSGITVVMLPDEVVQKPLELDGRRIWNRLETPAGETALECREPSWVGDLVSAQMTRMLIETQPVKTRLRRFRLRTSTTVDSRSLASSPCASGSVRKFCCILFMSTDFEGD